MQEFTDCYTIINGLNKHILKQDYYTIQLMTYIKNIMQWWMHMMNDIQNDCCGQKTNPN